jgi:hypothetical protein
MAPHMQRYIRTPFFMMQSKYDYWQLTNILALPSRPFHPNATQQVRKQPSFSPSQLSLVLVSLVASIM